MAITSSITDIANWIIANKDRLQLPVIVLDADKAVNWRYYVKLEGTGCVLVQEYHQFWQWEYLSPEGLFSCSRGSSIEHAMEAYSLGYRSFELPIARTSLICLAAPYGDFLERVQWAIQHGEFGQSTSQGSLPGI